MINKKLGYYTVNGQRYTSKIQACAEATKRGQDVTWTFNDTYFRHFNWQQEPEQSLDQLYDRRARQLREHYDYVVISYSGGADSHNIVESFLRQNLLIDELVVNTTERGWASITSRDPRDRRPQNAGAEHYLQTLPRLEEIRARDPRIKISVYDLTEYCLDHWLNTDDASWVLDKREGLNPLNVTRFNYLNFSETRKRFDRDRRICLILGVEKPRCYIYSDGGFYVRFTDRATNIVTIENHIQDYDNSTVEYFYWSPEGAEIVCKQAHVIRRWLDSRPDLQPLWWWQNITQQVIRLYHERLLREVLYTTWNPQWWQADKATRDWYSEFDHWFIHGLEHSPRWQVWREGIDWVRDNCAPWVNQGDRGLDDGLRLFGKNYLVGQIQDRDLARLRDSKYHQRGV